MTGHKDQTSPYLGHWPTPQDMLSMIAGARKLVSDETGYKLIERPVGAEIAYAAYLKYLCNPDPDPATDQQERLRLKANLRAALRAARPTINGEGDTGFDIIPQKGDPGWHG